MTERNRALVRVLRLAQRIHGARYVVSLEPLAKEFGVCTRTIRRDLHALEEAGWPVPRFRHFEPSSAIRIER